MKKNFKLLITMLLIVLSTVMVSCEQNFDDQDKDVIQGKWQDVRVSDLQTDKQELKMAYIDIAPYSYLPNARKITYYTYEIDTTQENPIIEHKAIGYYTVDADTLIIKDPQRQTNKYTIQYIRNDTLCYTDKRDSIYRYVRYTPKKPVLN